MSLVKRGHMTLVKLPCRQPSHSSFFNESSSYVKSWGGRSGISGEPELKPMSTKRRDSMDCAHSRQAWIGSKSCRPSAPCSTSNERHRGSSRNKRPASGSLMRPNNIADMLSASGRGFDRSKNALTQSRGRCTSMVVHKLGVSKARALQRWQTCVIVTIHRYGLESHSLSHGSGLSDSGRFSTSRNILSSSSSGHDDKEGGSMASILRVTASCDWWQVYSVVYLERLVTACETDNMVCAVSRLTRRGETSSTWLSVNHHLKYL